MAELSPQDRDVLLQAIIAGGGSGLENPAAALQNLLRAPGGVSAAQAIVAGLRNRLLPSGGAGMAAGSVASLCSGSGLGRRAVSTRQAAVRVA